MKPQTYRKRPLIIEAIQLTEESKYKCFDWVTGNTVPHFNEEGSPSLDIQTLEGVMTVNIGDWILKGTKGEFYPCKDDIFREVYELEEDYSEPTLSVDELLRRLADVNERYELHQKRIYELKCQLADLDAIEQELKGKLCKTTHI